MGPPSPRCKGPRRITSPKGEIIGWSQVPADARALRVLLEDLEGHRQRAGFRAPSQVGRRAGRLARAPARPAGAFR